VITLGSGRGAVEDSVAEGGGEGDDDVYAEGGGSFEEFGVVDLVGVHSVEADGVEV